jgi:signal peptidase I
LRNQTLPRLLRELIETAALIAVLYALVNLATARYVVDGLSMEPNFHNGQYLIVSRVNYLFGAPEHGDIVVFHYPNDPEKDYIKRVIGIPGDVIELRDQAVYVNGEMIDEPYINEPCSATVSLCRDEQWELGAGEYFMMGDNRNHSSDSRAFGPVNERFIVGEALLRYLPIQDWGLLTHVGYDNPR